MIVISPTATVARQTHDVSTKPVTVAPAAANWIEPSVDLANAF